MAAETGPRFEEIDIMPKIAGLQLRYALAAGILVALLWLTLAEFFDNGVYTTAQLENILNAPVIAVPDRA